MKAIEKKPCAPRVGERRTESSESVGDCGLDAGEILDRWYGNLSGFARAGVAKVKPGVMEAEGLAAECCGAALASVGHNMATFNEPGHRCSPGGVSLPVLVTKFPSFNSLAAGRAPGDSWAGT